MRGYESWAKLARWMALIGFAGSCNQALAPKPESPPQGDQETQAVSVATAVKPPARATPRAAPAAASEPVPLTPAAATPQPKARHPFHEPMPPRMLSKKRPAMVIAQMQPWQCRKELAKRKLPFKRDRRPAKGIGTALRFTGPLNGVHFVTPGRKSPYGKLDCRLALILDEMSKLLAAHEIKSVRVDNMYRPGARLPGSRRRSQHNYALAADVTQLTTTSGLVLDIEDDWQGIRGEPACGPDSEINVESVATIKLRNAICDIARAGLFHHILTPNYNEAHRDHLHLDIKRDAKSGSIQ